MRLRPTVARRPQQGAFANLFREIRVQEGDDYFSNYARMSRQSFEKLLSLVGHRLQRRVSPRGCVSPEERLLVTLRYLATGNSFTSLSYEFRLGRSTICGVVKNTCRAIWDILSPLEVPVNNGGMGGDFPAFRGTMAVPPLRWSDRWETLPDAMPTKERLTLLQLQTHVQLGVARLLRCGLQVHVRRRW